LRKSPGKEKATIYDCIVVPARLDEDENILDSITSIEVSIINGELLRAREFAQSAVNASQALRVIENIREETARVMLR
jgi:hypothetical protein